MAGYKRTDVGVIPKDWEVRQFSDHFRIYAGGDVPKHSLSNNQSPMHPYPIFANALSNRGLYGYTAERRSSGDSVTITARGHLGHAEYRGTPFFPVVRLLVLEPIGKLDARFTAYAINEVVTFAVESTGVPQLTAPQVGKYSVAAPPTIEEQRAIAAALSDADALLGGLDRLIAKKRDLKQAAMQQLLTGQTRLPGFHGEWEVKRLGDHVTFLRNGVNARAELLPEGRVKYLHYGDIHASTDSFLSPQTLPSLPDAKAARLDRLRDGDVIFADASEDIAGVCKSVELRGARDIEVVSGLHTIAARFDKTVLADGFKGFLQYCPSFATHLRRLAAGTKVYATNRAHIASVEMRLPSVAEQSAIAAVLSDMDAELAALEARRDKTRALKQGMMQELLTGRTRLV
jgi:type I restriction enzyme S subunit